MGKLLYNVGILSYSAVIRIASPFKEKAGLWVRGRKNQRIEEYPNSIWFHCASLGEFEQARPVIESIKKKDSSQKIVITFFSPSGYEVRKDYELADAVYYLPLDKPSNARKFLDKIQPRMAIFVKYEVWHYYFRELKQRKVPLYLISATFRKDQIYFKPHGKFMKRTLMMADHIFTQDQASEHLLKQHGFVNVTTAGDTRFDRVFSQASAVNENEKIARFKGDSILIIAGSSWPKEEQLLGEFIAANHPENVKLLIAPHDISEGHISNIRSKFDGSVLYSDDNNVDNSIVMILNTIGHLASAFKYGDIAIVGGGFKNALHNILEPATFGIPVIYGNDHQKYPEGDELAKSGGGFSISPDDFNATLSVLISDEQKRAEAGNAARKFIEDRIGATKTILEKIGLYVSE